MAAGGVGGIKVKDNTVGRRGISLLRRIFHDVFGGIPVRFTSAYPLQESIDRLQSRTKKRPFHGLFEPSAVGRVSERKVRLQKVMPFFGNSFKPVFRGKFRQEANAVILEGKFTRFTFTKVFMGFWFGFGLLWLLLTAVTSLGMALKPDKTFDDYVAICLPAFGVGVLMLGYLMVRFGWNWSRGDIEYLTAVIRQALDAEQAPGESS
jgi:hypothetical protein